MGYREISSGVLALALDRFKARRSTSSSAAFCAT
jgi:hypothetical protein